MFSDNAKCGSSKINLVENDEILSTDKEITEAFNKYFSNAVKSLNLQCDSEHLCDVSDETNPIERAIKKFKNNPSIININKNIPKTTNFEFSQVHIDSIQKMIDNEKSGTFEGIPTNCLKGVSDISAKFLNSVWNNEVLKDLNFANGLKLADIVPVFKKDDSTLVKNYSPVSLLPIISKIFERIMLNQVTAYMNEYLSPHLCGYRKGFSMQTALSSLIEKWKQVSDSKGYGAAVLMDLSKAFDTINHELLIAKLHAYGFTKKSLTVIFNYLSDRWQYVKIDSFIQLLVRINSRCPSGLCSRATSI